MFQNKFVKNPNFYDCKLFGAQEGLY